MVCFSGWKARTRRRQSRCSLPSLIRYAGPGTQAEASPEHGHGATQAENRRSPWRFKSSFRPPVTRDEGLPPDGNAKPWVGSESRLSRRRSRPPGRRRRHSDWLTEADREPAAASESRVTCQPQWQRPPVTVTVTGRTVSQ